MPADATPYGILAANPDQFGTLVSLIDRVGLDADLNTPGASITILAPVDSAFEGLDLAAMSDDDVRALLLHHVVDSSLDTATLFAQSGELDTLNGPVVIDATARTISGATVVFPDLSATGDPNGFVQGIDQVLLP